MLAPNGRPKLPHPGATSEVADQADAAGGRDQMDGNPYISAQHTWIHEHSPEICHIGLEVNERIVMPVNPLR